MIDTKRMYSEEHQAMETEISKEIEAFEINFERSVREGVWSNINLGSSINTDKTQHLLICLKAALSPPNGLEPLYNKFTM